MQSTIMRVQDTALIDIPTDLRNESLMLSLRLVHLTSQMKRTGLTREIRAALKTEKETVLMLIEIVNDRMYEAYMNAPVERISAQDGKTKCFCRRADVGGPTDPGMERFWTM